MLADQPQFQYWARVHELELCILQLSGSIRNSNFLKYPESLALLIPWVYNLDHVNYARWLSIHIRDMSSLSQMHPTLYHIIEFVTGKFVAHNTKQPFSAIALDQAHEQVHAFVKDGGGAVGLTENKSSLQRWMVPGPDISRMITEF